MRKNLKNKKIYNYFIDTIYKIIPKNRRDYKLMTISCYNSETNTSNLACSILYLYEDSKSFYYIFKYLHDFFNFSPKLLNIDFSQSQRKALLENNLIDNKPEIINF